MALHRPHDEADPLNGLVPIETEIPHQLFECDVRGRTAELGTFESKRDGVVGSRFRFLHQSERRLGIDESADQPR